MAKEPQKDLGEAPPASDEKPICGIIMPISAMPPDYEAAHWADVRRVIEDAICKSDMRPQIVSDSFESDVIQKRIVRNLYENPVVVCDVSGLNPNVMFELGMRITFKKPVIIVTDDVQRIPFDTSVIEHLPYPRDLHIHLTTAFIEKLSEKIVAMHAQVKGRKYRSFLETFGTFDTFEPSTQEVPAGQYFADRLDEIERSLRMLNRASREGPAWASSATRVQRNALNMASAPRRFRFRIPSDAKEVASRISAIPGVNSVSFYPKGEAFTLDVTVEPFMTPTTEETLLMEVIKGGGELEANV